MTKIKLTPAEQEWVAIYSKLLAPKPPTKKEEQRLARSLIKVEKILAKEAKLRKYVTRRKPLQ